MRTTLLTAVVWCLWLVLGVQGECALGIDTYMPFIVRVTDITPSTVATGSIISPNAVLTTCVDLQGKSAKDLECYAVQAHYKIGKIDIDHFKQADDKEDTNGCVEKRSVASKKEHPRCPLTTQVYDEFGEDYTRYNIAVLIISRPFRNHTEAVPALPFVADISTQLSMVDTFNSLRTERCEIPIFNGLLPKAWFQSHMAFRSLPLQAECKALMCHQKIRTCSETVSNHTGFVLCARRVVQREQGITWRDYLGHDRDLWDERTCETMKWVVGAPLVCQGSTIGIVTECQAYGLIISTIYALRIFLHQIIDAGYTEEVMYMDTSDIPTEKDDPQPQSLLFEGVTHKRQREFTYSSANRLQLGLFQVGLVLLMT